MTDIKNIILTFDYEVFLGSRSGTVENCILIPTQKLIEIFDKFSIRNAIFFVDTTYLIQLKRNNSEACKADYEKITKQLSLLHQKGHYIFPHLHTHWLDATYLPDINQWDLSNINRYSFSSLSTEEKEMLFSESVQLLEEICGKKQELGYRAGGWCIEPFADFKPFFKKHNIRYDFSVMAGYSCVSEFQNFDFRLTPNKPFYSFDDKTVSESKDGAFIEIPISHIGIKRINRLLNKFFIKLLYKKGIKNYGDGLSTHSASLKEITPFGHEMASIELLTMMNISNYINNLNKSSTLHFISHPKMLNPHNLNCFEVLLKKMQAKYTLNTDFKKMISNTI
ncbi:MAG: polysaccharide deacetylase family protein [Bacteroidia bacterium]